MASFHIILSPQRRDDQLTLAKRGDSLIVNGQPIELPRYNPELSPNEWIIGAPSAKDDVWTINIFLPHGPAAPQEALFPQPIMAVEDGPIALPSYGPAVQNRLPEGIAEPFLSPCPRRMAKPDDLPNLNSFYNDPSALDAIPESRAAICDCITYWAQTDMLLRIFLLTRFGPDRAAVNALIDRHAKSDDALAQILRIAIAMTGSADLSARGNTFLERRGAVKAVRDAFAHGTWLLSPDFQGSILLMQSKDARKMMQDFQVKDWFDYKGIRATFDIWTPEDFRRAGNAAAALRNEAIQLTGQFPPAQAAGG